VHHFFVVVWFAKFGGQSFNVRLTWKKSESWTNLFWEEAGCGVRPPFLKAKARDPNEATTSLRTETQARQTPVVTNEEPDLYFTDKP
jgi:hypothetical protein